MPAACRPAVESLRAEEHELPDDLIRHISPQIWEHISLTGIYDWMREPQPKGTFRPLRTGKKIRRGRLIRRTERNLFPRCDAFSEWGGWRARVVQPVQPWLSAPLAIASYRRQLLQVTPA